MKGLIRQLAVLILAGACSVRGAGAANAPVVPGKIIISGATGALGGEVTELLLARGVAASDLILVTRSPDKLKDLAARGASVRQGDFDHPETLSAAFQGGQRLLLISSQETADKLFAQNLGAINAAKADGVHYVVYTSFVNAQKMAKFVLPGHYQTEQALAKSGMEWTSQRNQDYQDNVLEVVPFAVLSGKYANNFAPGKAASVSKHDCASVAAALLASPSHKNQVIEVTGPQLLSTEDVANAISEVMGKPVKAEYLTDDAYTSALRGAGLPESRVEFFVGLGKAQHAGVYEVKTSIVEQITGTKPMSEKDFLAARKDDLTAAVANAAKGH